MKGDNKIFKNETEKQKSKNGKNRNRKFLEKQLSNSMKEISVFAETVTDSKKGRLKKSKILKDYKVINAKEITQLTKTLKQKSTSKSPKNQNI
jgi:hypothetical protein